MPGVFITSGMDIRISNLQIPLDGSDPPSMTLMVRSDTWHHWLLTACDNTTLAATEESVLHSTILREKDAEHELAELKRLALEAEFRAAMTVLTACAFAIDAFYSTVVARFGKHPDAELWNKNRTARHSQIAATFHFHLKIKNAGMPNIRQFLKELFKFRDLAVHPPTEFADPAYRADMDAGVEPRFVTFSAKHARTVLALTVELLTVLIEKADRVATGDTEKWVEFAKERLDVVRATAMSIPHVFPENDEPDESAMP
ncbi:hypothetical protein EXE59_14490 [Nocardioides eburneiflavus]|uniref:Uncharacterized protein n=1 Tax=Nocardioides eburneiflavus TaxID=2518372 RepID=A0A4Z1CML0_9ACTN|nr:hypothetical protein [Nocardioides eburneiflavus]TGN65039.1 hypothetical protein EXE59_14490 [Nocardioides eburneiflavus]